MRVDLFVGDVGRFTPEDLGYDESEEFSVGDLIDFDEGGEVDVWKIDLFETTADGEVLAHLVIFREGGAS